MDITGQVIQAIDGWLNSLAVAVLHPALVGAGQLLFQTPAYDSIPEVRTAWGVVSGITDALLVLAVLAGGILVMSSGTFETGYTVKVMLPRLGLAAVLSNASLVLCGALIRLENALVLGLLGPDPATSVWAQVTEGISLPALQDQMVSSLLAIAAAVMAVLLIVVYIARDLILLAGTILAPLALAMHALPQTAELASLWLRTYVAALFVQVVESVLVEIGVQLLHHSDWLGGATSALVSGLMLVTLLYMQVRLPLVAYRWAFGHALSQSGWARMASGAARTVGSALA